MGECHRGVDRAAEVVGRDKSRLVEEVSYRGNQIFRREGFSDDRQPSLAGQVVGPFEEACRVGATDEDGGVLRRRIVAEEVQEAPVDFGSVGQGVYDDSVGPFLAQGVEDV